MNILHHRIKDKESTTINEKYVLKNFSKITGKHLRWRFLFSKAEGLGLELYRKRSPLQVFFCVKFEKLFTNDIKHLNTAGSLRFSCFKFFTFWEIVTHSNSENRKLII